MTERLYYDQSYLTEFDAVVTDCRSAGEEYEIALDRSAFYPTSGGQPYDTGYLCWPENETAVTDVTVDKAGEVWHRISLAIPVGTKVHGRIDWERRWDHMQQHGGEHMLAGAVYELLGGSTVGLHLGREDSSIDVTLPDGRTHLTDVEKTALEETVNRRIQRDDPVRCWFPGAEELAALPLRKPPTVTEHIRIVAFGDYEMVACGGTHPSSAGQIGLVKLLNVTPAKGKARLTFVCGMRAFRYLARCQRAAEDGGALLSCKVAELTDAIVKMKEQNAELSRALSRSRALEYRRAMEDAEDKGLCCLWLEDAEMGALALATGEYIKSSGKTLLCGGNGRLIFARSADGSADMAALLRKTARGGGKPDYATGAGGREAIEAARKMLIEG